jgi:hypothetical protein
VDVLLYTLELGSMERNIVRQALRTGQPIPDRILNAPMLRQGLVFYLEAFFDLDSERSQGMGLGRIPWIAITQYAEYYGLDDEQTDSLLYFIKALDSAHLQRIKEKGNDA